MKSILSSVKQFVVSEDGPTAVEYAVLLGLIIIGAIAVVGSLGTTVTSIFSNAADKVDASGAATAGAGS